MILRNLVLSVAALTLIARAGAAQTAPIRPASSALFRPAAVVARSDTLHLPKTYWKEGALIVGIPSAIFGGALGIGLCHYSETPGEKNCILPALGLAAFMGGLGAITGALIGGQFERE